MIKVSVLVPLYNTDENYLREMIESILNQTYTDFELLLLNDSPNNQNLKKVIDSYQDERICYLENSRNLGISASRNKLIEIAKGDYLAIVDHDDICFPERLNLQVKCLDEFPEVGVCSSWIHEIPSNKLGKRPEFNAQIKQGLLDGCCVIHPAAMIRKSVLIDNNIRYEENYSPAEDYMLWVRLMGVTMFYNIQQPLIYYRNHEQNTTHQQRDKMVDRDAMIKCIAYRDYSYYLQHNAKTQWIYLFGFLPLIKIKQFASKKIFYLFGFIPLCSFK